MVPQPRARNACQLSRVRGLASSVFARHYSRNHRLFSLPVGTEMFHFPTFPPPAVCVQAGVAGHDSSRVSPFGDPRITVRLPTPRGLSQAPTSFIGSWCLGIHRAPLLTWPQRCSRPLCSSQATVGYRSDPPRTPALWSRSAKTGHIHTRAPATDESVASAAVGTERRVRAHSLRTQQRA
jgi:hypothetical protein